MTKTLLEHTWRKKYHQQGGNTITLRPFWRVSLCWEPRDLWMGVFYDTTTTTMHRDKIRWRPWRAPIYDIYICPLPTIVIKIGRLK